MPAVEGQSPGGTFSEWSQKPDTILFNKEARAALEKAINDLPEEFRTVVILRDVENQSNQEVAEILNLSVAAVKSRLHRARLALRRTLGEYLDRQEGSSGRMAATKP